MKVLGCVACVIAAWSLMLFPEISHAQWSSPAWIATGPVPGGSFGCSVSSAGDVNGDGFADVIVGLTEGWTVGTGKGRAYIFFGGTPMDHDPDVTLMGPLDWHFFGQRVDNAGDVNGDGFDDVIVGNQSYTDGHGYIYFGGSAMDNIVDVTLPAVPIVGHFGSTVRGAGDVNGDGFADVIVNACWWNVGVGRAYIYFGGASMDNVADVTFTGLENGAQYGSSVDGAGDINADGFDDVIVGEFFNDAAGVDAGRAYIYFGGGAMDTDPDVTLTGFSAGDNFGNPVAGAGDLNRDGFSDVIVSAFYPDTDPGALNKPHVFIFYGGSAMDNVVDVALTGAAPGDRFGSSIESAGDVNGDGFSDVIVAAELNDAGGENAGQAYVYFGGASMDAIPEVTITGEAAGDYLGYQYGAAAGAGDVNNDGLDDVIVGAAGNDAGVLNGGSAYIYLAPDLVPPTIQITVDPALLWPPNHKLRTVQVTANVNDNLPGVSFVLQSITSNEPANGLGDGDTPNDIQNAAIGTPDLTFQLRSERSGKGSGRVYTVTYVATDAAGNTASASATVVVPHSPAKSDFPGEGQGLPGEVALIGNYPNPFNPSTTIHFALPARLHVILTVYNTLGQEVRELVNGEVEAGYHAVRFDASGLSSGVYLCRLHAGDFVKTMKLTLAR